MYSSEGLLLEFVYQELVTDFLYVFLPESRALFPVIIFVFSDLSLDLVPDGQFMKSGCTVTSGLDSHCSHNV